ncbi:YegP family protein [Pseudarthrobacter sp. P1]|uniref:YegP family protein n=1 Tax=Pseudarthrobacter sp. P1 TaxID=3418418 RepID=UPI003CF2BFEF
MHGIQMQRGISYWEGRAPMAGAFEIVRESGNSFRFRLTGSDGSIVAVSPEFPNIKAVVAGINAVRENAATGFIVDRTSSPGHST